ncbi:hypothetical protein CCR75_009475 [Bremia lactucae]|uniref:Uncharacterized protein n=1 Tax=Bremia lactucae TaxID=4779 RepID=A0A976ICN3_BRELC|nr:hypothetical protein CCR75_009475 [Bremia lactucae]
MLLSKPQTLQVCRLKLKPLARLQAEQTPQPASPPAFDMGQFSRFLKYSHQQQQQQLNAFMAQTNAFQRTAAIGAVAAASAAAPATKKEGRTANLPRPKKRKTWSSVSSALSSIMPSTATNYGE